MSIKKYIPPSIKLKIRQTQRVFSDMWSGHQFARKLPKEAFEFSLVKGQEIKQTSSSLVKLENLRLASNQIESLIIKPNEVFSFWKAVGKPSSKKGFQEGRTIVNGALETSVGGGLCQLSGLIYYVSLEANLEIIERHNHSVDIYDDCTRYTPLGSDATVVYGYKDLRIRNNKPFSLRFDVQIEEDSIILSLNSPSEIQSSTVTFKSQELANNRIEVTTSIDGNEKIKSTYKRA